MSAKIFEEIRQIFDDSNQNEEQQEVTLQQSTIQMLKKWHYDMPIIPVVLSIYFFGVCVLPSTFTVLLYLYPEIGCSLP